MQAHGWSAGAQQQAELGGRSNTSSDALGWLNLPPWLGAPVQWRCGCSMAAATGQDLGADCSVVYRCACSLMTGVGQLAGQGVPLLTRPACFAACQDGRCESGVARPRVIASRCEAELVTGLQSSVHQQHMNHSC